MSKRDQFTSKSERDRVIRAIDARTHDIRGAIERAEHNVLDAKQAIARWKSDRAVTLLAQNFLLELDRHPSLTVDKGVFVSQHAEIDADAINQILARLRMTLEAMACNHIRPIHQG